MKSWVQSFYQSSEPKSQHSLIDWESLDKKQVAAISVGTLAVIGVSYYLLTGKKSDR